MYYVRTLFPSSSASFCFACTLPSTSSLSRMLCAYMCLISQSHQLIEPEGARLPSP